MIYEVVGDITKADVDALVNPVNTVGVMGAGLAKRVKLTYPGVFREYATACRSGLLTPGCVMVHRVEEPQLTRYIISFPTKRHWSDRSQLEWIQDGLLSLRDTLEWVLVDDPGPPIRSIAMPRLGCGLGGLRWEDVRLLIYQRLSNLSEADITIYTRPFV